MEKVVFENFQGPIPAGYVPVSRWCDENEVKIWKAKNNRIPLEIGRGLHGVYVTLPGAPQPGGTGTFRIDFYVHQAMLDKTANPEWKQIFKNTAANTPIYNVRAVATR
ncbi:hypothetical protein [Bradyrhizobium sp. WSM1417]|uniref:hypothetical protein n=1 Tax=Bradyrhizobium sp. WSM1417 TaxID=754500 RepID=UPI000487AC5E|nr:hypothetical protein [Bradyrhizobium sp. WSM1417]